MIDCRCEPHASGTNRCVLCQTEARATRHPSEGGPSKAEVALAWSGGVFGGPPATTAASLGIPSEPPPGHVPAPPYSPPKPKSLEDRVSELEQQVADLKRALADVRSYAHINSSWGGR